jgi:hypothetical protein
MKLLDFASNEYSQHGEDGMIGAVMGWIGIIALHGRCVEFGAWDGIKFSNTARLWKAGWSADLIEADEKRFKELEKAVVGAKDVRVMCERIGIIEGTRWYEPRCVAGYSGMDLVSIDVDGNDYWIFKGSPPGPKLYVVEYNTTIPGWMDVVTPYASDNNFGCSLGALVRVADEKGYAHIGDTKSNGFFLRKDLLNKIPKLDVDLHDAANQGEMVYLMTSYSGAFRETGIGPYGRTHWYEGEVNLTK